MENLTGGTPPVRYLPCVVPCKLYFPLEKIMFDDNEKLSIEEKAIYLLNQVLNRLYEYFSSDIRYMFDHDNPIIRLADTDMMDEKYFMSKEEITWDMLRY